MRPILVIIDPITCISIAATSLSADLILRTKFLIPMDEDLSGQVLKYLEELGYKKLKGVTNG